MRSVDPQAFIAAARFRVIEDAGARFVGRYRTDPIRRTSASVSEFALPSGEVVARKVTAAGGQTECWLRADLAEQAAAALRDEAAESARIAAEVVTWSLGRDAERAAEHGMTLEQYRNRRNHGLARIDQRRGKSSIGMG